MTDFHRIRVLGSLALSIGIAPQVRAQAEKQYSNPSRITINTPTVPGPDGRVLPSKAMPYPSTIHITDFGPNEKIAKITVTIHDLSHEVPDDIDILLVKPDDKSIVIVSDAGAFMDPGISVTLTLDDDATRPLPDDAPFVSGIYKPSNFEVDERDTFPQPAPAPSPATQLSIFAGASPNGFWDLYVVDDEVFDAGSIAGGWTLTIRTAADAAPSFRRGDTDGNAAANLTDAIFFLNALFLGGPQPACADAADTDDNGVLDISDAVFLLNRLFLGGIDIPAPGPAECGEDPTPDELRCGPGTTCSNFAMGSQRGAQAPPPCPT